MESVVTNIPWEMFRVAAVMSVEASYENSSAKYIGMFDIPKASIPRPTSATMIRVNDRHTKAIERTL